MLRFMVCDFCLFSTSPGVLAPRRLVMILGMALAFGLTLGLLVT